MSKKIYSLAIAVLISLVAQAQSSYYFGSDEKFDESIPTPEEFFGFPIGSALVRYDRVVEYFRLLDKLSDRTQFKVIGYTHENREYVILHISTPENIKNLDSQFHELLYRCSGSNAYTDVLMRIHKKMTKYRKASVSEHSRAQQSNDEHMAIYQALASHDPDAAEKAVLIHVGNAMKRMEHMEQTEGAES